MLVLEDVKKALEALENGAGLYEVVTATLGKSKSALEAERKKGIEEVNKKNREAENLRKFKKSFDSLGFDPDESDLDDFTSEISDNLSQLEELTKKGGDGKFDFSKSSEFKEMQKQLKTITKNSEKQKIELDVEREKATSLKVKNQNGQIRTALVKSLNDKVYGADILAENLINNGKVKLEEDEQTIVFVNGEDSVDYEEGIGKLLETRKDIVKNQQSPGGGTGGQGGTGSSNEDKKNWVKEFNQER